MLIRGSKGITLKNKVPYYSYRNYTSYNIINFFPPTILYLR